MPDICFLSPKQHKSGNSSSKKYAVLNARDQSKQSIHEQVKKQIIAGDKCLFTLLKLLLNKSKIRLDKVIAKPIMFIKRDTSNIFLKHLAVIKRKQTLKIKSKQTIKYIYLKNQL